MTTPERETAVSGKTAAQSNAAIESSLPPDGDACNVALTVYAGARATKPAKQDALSWDAFCAEVEALAREETAHTDKRDLPAFGPYRLKPGTTRTAANVERMANVAMLDVDSGLDVDALRERIAELGIAAIVHGSPSDDPAGERKARVYVRLDAEHAPSDAWRVRAGVGAMLGVTCDPSTSNADRIGFCGRLAGTEPRYVERFEGNPVAIATLPAASATSSTAPVATRDPAPVASTARDPARNAASLAVLGALGPWSDYDGRKHDVCGAIGGMLRKCGWSRADAAEVIRAWLPYGVPGVNVEHGVRWACAAWDRDADEVSGRGVLDAIVGPRVGAVIEAAALLPWRAGSGAGIELPQRAARADDFTTIKIRSLDETPPKPRYIVRGLDLAVGKVSALQGFANAGKTPFALALALCVASGAPFLGFEVEQCPVGYLDCEASDFSLERAARVRLGLGLTKGLPITYAEADMFSATAIDEYERLIVNRGIGMLVVDTYSSALPGDISFNESSFRKWADELGRLARRTNCMILVLVHETKAAEGRAGVRGMSGHGSLAGGVQTSIALNPHTDDKNVIDVTCARKVRRGFDAFTIRWIDVPNADAPEGEALVAERIETTGPRGRGSSLSSRNDERAADKRVKVREAGIAMMTALSAGRWVPKRELLDLGGGHRNAGLEALAKLVKAGLVEYRLGSYARTEAGSQAGGVAVEAALGHMAGFQRGV